MAAGRSICCDACLEGLVRGGGLHWTGQESGRLPVLSLLPYRGPGRRLVTAVKYGGAHGLSRRMACLLARQARRLAPEADFRLLCPVPSRPARQRELDGNPAARLAQDLARALDARYGELLVRHGQGGQQKSLNRTGRLGNRSGGFALHRRAGILAGQAVWLVDDVVTTGATLARCARELRQGGLTVAGAFVLARTPTADESGGLADAP
ncbi:MAG: ComF family protein [Calditrichaeota bacterium]|nr:ComF family protein [Calditrichota bacterium]